MSTRKGVPFPAPAAEHSASGAELPMLKRVHIEIRGAVQGVGFRPFIYRLASEHHLAGWVMNAASGVSIDVEGGGTGGGTVRPQD